MDRPDTDFYKYYLLDQKSFKGINLGKGKRDPKEYTLPDELKVLFLACKVCKLKTQYWSAKYHDIANKIRRFMNAENMFADNPKDPYYEINLKKYPNQNLNPKPYVPYHERIRLIRKNERDVNRRNAVESDTKKLFNKQNDTNNIMYAFKSIRNPLNDKFERKQIKKEIEERKVTMDLTKIPYYKPNPIYNYWENEMVPIVPVPEKQEDCYTYEEHRAFKTMYFIVKMIRIPNMENKYTYRFMDIIGIIVQYGITIGDEDVDSRMDDKGGKKRQHNSDSDSYDSLKTTRDFYSKKDDS
jgi:hypothetical protein